MPEYELLVNLLLSATSIALGVALSLVTAHRPKWEGVNAGGEREDGK